MRFKVGDRVKIVKPNSFKSQYINHVGIINDIANRGIGVIITDDDSLNESYYYFGEKVRDSGKWWYKDEIELYNVNRRLE